VGQIGVSKARHIRYTHVGGNKGRTNWTNIMNYYKRLWDETTGEELTDSWGTSTFYFETDNEDNVIRQLQIFQNGNALKYWDKFKEDKYGFVSDQPLDKEEFESYKIDKDEFERTWTKTQKTFE
jgi:hypothetical protein